MNLDNMMAALEMMGQGMLGIFVVLGIIALLVFVMQKIDNRKVCMPHAGRAVRDRYET